MGNIVTVDGIVVRRLISVGTQGPAGVVAASAPITYDGGTQTVGIDASGFVASVNGSTGVVVLTPADVVGPAAATDGTVALFDGTTGKVVKEGFLIGLGRPRNSNGDQYYAPINGSITNVRLSDLTFAGAAPRVRYAPFIVPVPVNINSAMCFVQTAPVASTVDFYLIKANQDWQPVAGTETTIVTGLDTTTTGVKQIVSLDITLTPGRYLMEVVSSQQPVLRSWHVPVPDANAIDTINNQNGGVFFAVSGVAHSDWASVFGSSGAGSPMFLLFKWTYV